MKQVIMSVVLLGLVATAQGPQVKVVSVVELDQLTVAVNEILESRGEMEADESEVCDREFDGGQLNEAGECVYIDWGVK